MPVFEVSEPTTTASAVTKNYSDTKNRVVAVSFANMSLTGLAQTADSVALSTIGQVVLANAQTTTTQNGPWTVQSGAWTRPAWCKTGQSASAMPVFVAGGINFKGSTYICENAPGADIVDTSVLVFGRQILAGNGLAYQTGGTGNGLAVSPGNSSIAVASTGTTISIPNIIARVAADSNITPLSGLTTGIDGVTMNTIGQIAMLTAQSTATQNGPWVIQSGAWARPDTFATSIHAAGFRVDVMQGTIYLGSTWICANALGADVVGTNNLDFRGPNSTQTALAITSLPASKITFSPDDSNRWGSGNPATVDQALNQLADMRALIIDYPGDFSDFSRFRDFVFACAQPVVVRVTGDITVPAGTWHLSDFQESVTFDCFDTPHEFSFDDSAKLETEAIAGLRGFSRIHNSTSAASGFRSATSGPAKFFIDGGNRESTRCEINNSGGDPLFDFATSSQETTFIVRSATLVAPSTPFSPAIFSANTNSQIAIGSNAKIGDGTMTNPGVITDVEKTSNDFEFAYDQQMFSAGTMISRTVDSIDAPFNHYVIPSNIRSLCVDSSIVNEVTMPWPIYDGWSVNIFDMRASSDFGSSQLTINVPPGPVSTTIQDPFNFGSFGSFCKLQKPSQSTTFRFDTVMARFYVVQNMT